MIVERIARVLGGGVAGLPAAAASVLLYGGLAGGALAQQISGDIVRIGVLTDESGNFSALSGTGSVVAAKMAVEDFGGKVRGKPIDVVDADHQNKTDVGLQIARQWYDADGVDAIVDVPNSAIVLGVQDIARERGKALLVSGGGTVDLTGPKCSPTGIHWTWDTYAFATGTAKAMLDQGLKDWFFLTADFAFGQAMQRDATRIIEAAGGRVFGSVRHPLQTADFSSFLLQAQQSRAQVIALANGGSDTVNAVKQASEFGLTRGSEAQKLAAMAIYITEVHAIGLAGAQGLQLTTAFYWDRTDESRAWSRRFFDRHGAMPSQSQAGVYSAVMHYLKAVDATGTDTGKTVVDEMKRVPVNDFFAKNGRIRTDGRMVHDMYLAEVKTPEESNYPWDYYKILRTLPGEEVFRPPVKECPLNQP
ncbi:MAG TPA: ABC transporter substrate-binding protein [Stellaceae bacterium]|jgi:branched-chain amino acid transport system substrate-binding protein